MKLVVFGLTITSSWGNGHATLLRGLFAALVARGHRIVFFERDVSYYAAHRDLLQMHGVEICLYKSWDEISTRANKALCDADVGIVTSYCPDAIGATQLLLDQNRPLRVFYDLDTPVTLDAIRTGAQVPYIGERRLLDFDLVLSYTGGRALVELQQLLGARFVAPLYGSVDLSVHRPSMPQPEYVSDLSYLGTYADDRQGALETLFLNVANECPQERFLIGGSKYPVEFPWLENVWYVQHVPPFRHSGFYSSSRVTLNITRAAMAHMGYCPSGRLFEAAACATPIISDTWDGLDEFFEPGSEILIAAGTEDVCAALNLSDAELNLIGEAAHERTINSHTAKHRAIELENILERALDNTTTKLYSPLLMEV